MRIAQIHNTHGSPLNDVHISYIHNTKSAICICIPQTLKPKNIHRHFSVRVIASHIHSIVFLLLALSPRLCASVVLCAVHVHAQNIYTRPTEKKLKGLLQHCESSKGFTCKYLFGFLSYLNYTLRSVELVWLGYDMIRCGAIEHVQLRTEYISSLFLRGIRFKPLRMRSWTPFYGPNVCVCVRVHMCVRVMSLCVCNIICICYYAFARKCTVPNHRHLLRWARLGRLERFCTVLLRISNAMRMK